MHDHDHRWDRNWRRMEAMARRGFRKFGNFEANINPGEWGGFGGNFRIGRMLASGDLRLVALFLIEQQPRHGYDLIKAIEEQSKGFYSPSPGIVYPALTYLEEAGYVTSAAEGNKKLYTITDEGRGHLNDNREAIQSTLDFLAKAGSGMEHLRERMASQDFHSRRARRSSSASDFAAWGGSLAGVAGSAIAAVRRRIRPPRPLRGSGTPSAPRPRALSRPPRP